MEVEKSSASEATPKSEPSPSPVDNGLGMTELLTTVLADTPEQAVAAPADPGTPSSEAPKATDEKPAIASGEPKDEGKAAEAKPTEDVEKLQKRLKDTRDALTQERQKNLSQEQRFEALAKQLETLTKKIDGTWEEEQAPPPQQLVDRAVFNTKIEVSEAAAIEAYGAEEVARMVTGPDAIWRTLEKDPSLNLKVLSSKMPVIEACKVVKEHEARQKYGTDPETMRANIRKELEQEYRQKYDAERKAKPAVEIPQGLRHVQGATARDAKESEAETNGTVRLDTLFPNFVKTAG